VQYTMSTLSDIQW